MFKRALLGVVGLAASAGVATAGPGFVPRTVTVNAPGVMNSVGDVGNAGNGSFMHTFNGPAFRVGEIRISGVLVDGGVSVDNFANDASWNINSAQGEGRNFLGVTPVQAYTGPVAVGPTSYALPALPFFGYTSGTWNFQSYEGFDDSPNSQPENIWNSASFEFVEMTPAAAPSSTISLGAIGGSTMQSIAHTDPNAVHWLSFDFAGGANSHLEIDTLGSAIPLGLNPLGDNDTVIALYDSYGVLVYSSDNINLATNELESRIITGDGVLPAGTYYLAATTANAGVGASDFNVTNTSIYGEGQGVGTIKVNITAVPAPASAALLGLGGMVAGSRRRKN